MPRLPIDYNNTIIYKIQHMENEELIYVGHTTDFTKRKHEHRRSCKTEAYKAYNAKVYKMIRDNGGWEAFNMVEVSVFPCANSQEACKEEDRVMREMNASMNVRRAFITREDYLNYQKEYVEQNKERISERKKEYYSINKDELLQKNHAYNMINRDKINKKSREYHEEHKEATELKNKVKVMCECGCEIRRDNKLKHMKTKKHADKMAKQKV